MSYNFEQAGEQRQVRTTARGRTYEWRGEQFWSVTTIIKSGLKAPALERWTPREVAKFAVANHHQISAMLNSVRMEQIDKKIEPTTADNIRRLFGLTPRVLGPRGGVHEEGTPLYIVREDPDAISAAVSWLINAPYRDKSRRGDIGTAVHAELEAYALDKPRPEPPLLVRPHVEAFREWLEVFSPTIVLAEATCYNRTEAYAGRLDAVVKIGDYHWLLDYTTSRSGVFAEKAYQCCAYSRAEFVGLPDGTEVPMPKVDGACVLHLTENGWTLFPVVIDDNVFRDFRIIREAFDIVERRSKQVVGRPVETPEALNFLAVGNAPSLELLPGGLPAIPVVEKSTERGEDVEVD